MTATRCAFELLRFLGLVVFVAEVAFVAGVDFLVVRFFGGRVVRLPVFLLPRPLLELNRAPSALGA
jgi:hypothetical protein